jgi:hypothetical protein
MKVFCPYCALQAHKILGVALFPEREPLKNKIYYVCHDCDAYIGCHAKTHHPYGRLANSELRALKAEVHQRLLKIHKGEDRLMKKHEAYEYLANEMNMSRSVCQVSYFTVQQCQEAIAILDKLLRIN